MAISLQSPGALVSIIDESNYTPGGPGTVPLIVVATEANKLNPSGGIAPYTAAGSGGQIYLLGSQKDAITGFGAPVYPKDPSGNVIYGSELAEHGLLSLHSVLGVTNAAYVIRADIDLAQLKGTSVRPTGAAAGGTLWQDTATTSWGIFTWNAATQSFVKASVLTITDESDLTGSPGAPKTSLGKVGSFAVVATNLNNPVYYKNAAGSWVLVGSTAWQTSVPAAVATNANVINLTAGNSVTINGTVVTLTGTTDVQLAADINTAAITGVTAGIVGGRLALYVTSAAKSNGTVVDGKLVLANTAGTPLSALGLGTSYMAPAVQLSAHSSVPYWKSTDVAPRPTGSVWVKTTPVNNGANLTMYQWNAVTQHWAVVSAPLYANDQTATRYLDPTRGGLGIALGSIYVSYDVSENATATYKVMQRVSTGATKITGSTSNPTFTSGNTFTVKVSTVGSPTLSSAYTVTLSGTTAASFVADVLAKDIPNVTAGLNANGQIVLQHTTGGVMVLANGTGTPLTAAGFSASVDYVSLGSDGSSLVASNWQPATYVAQPTPPVTHPEDGTLWYYSTPLEADILINDGTAWRGYSNVTSDARGYDLTVTDPNGPIISPSAPTLQSDGTALVYGDLWIDTSDLDNYPQIYRWQSYQGINQWIALDMADTTTEDGIVFADARWDTSGETDPVLDAMPLITDLLKSDYVDIDAPDPSIYPRGALLFNTRRSSYNVKQYSVNHFNFDAYPLQSLPSVVNTWVSVSGRRASGIPYMGRRAVRSMVVAAMRAAVDLSIDAREDQRAFNLLVAPGYPELTANLVALNNDRRNTGFVLADTPMGLTSDLNTVQNYILNSVGEQNDSEDGLATIDEYTAVFYPGACQTNDLSGNTVIAPATHMMLRTIVRSDINSYPWFAPAGPMRGTVDNATAIGYVDRPTGKFVKIGTTQALRDLLYPNNINPIMVEPNVGIMNYGNKTRAGTTTAMDRINVARLISYLRYQLEALAKPLMFEPNDKVTRDEAKAAVEALMNDLIATRAIGDYLVVCDRTNNTNQSLDRSELHIDIAIEPIKAVEFIYIPVRVQNTGTIGNSNA